MGWLEEVIDFVNQNGQNAGVDIYDYMNDPKRTQNIIDSLPMGTVAQDPRIIRGVQDNDFSVRGQSQRPTNMPTKQPKGRIGGIGAAVPLGLALGETIRQIPGWDEYVEENVGGKIYDLINQPKPTSTDALRKPQTSTIPDTRLTNKQLLETIRRDKSIKAEDAGKERLSPNTERKLGGATLDEVKKAWTGATTPEQVTNTRLFPREDSQSDKKPEDYIQEQLDRFTKVLAPHIEKQTGVDMNNYDVDREARRATDNYFGRMPVTQQDYNKAYIYFKQEANDKLKNAQTMYNSLLGRFMTDAREDKRFNALQEQYKQKADTETAVSARKKNEALARANSKYTSNILKAKNQRDMQLKGAYDDNQKQAILNDYQDSLDTIKEELEETYGLHEAKVPDKLLSRIMERDTDPRTEHIKKSLAGKRTRQELDRAKEILKKYNYADDEIERVESELYPQQTRQDTTPNKGKFVAGDIINVKGKKYEVIRNANGGLSMKPVEV